MKKVQNYAARWIVSAFKPTPNGACNTLAGLAPLGAEMDKIVDNAFKRWQNLPPRHGVSLVLAKPRMTFLDTHRAPTWLVMSRSAITSCLPTLMCTPWENCHGGDDLHDGQCLAMMAALLPS